MRPHLSSGGQLLLLTLTLIFTVLNTVVTAAYNPTIIIIPGAWTTGELFQPLINVLSSSGYNTRIHSLPSVNSPNPAADTVATDTAFYRSFICSSVDNGEDVVILTHSYGGVPGSVAANGLSKAERAAKGEQGGILGIMMVTSFPLKEGASTLDQLPGGVWLPWFQAHVSPSSFSFFLVGCHTLTSPHLERHLPNRHH